MPYQPRTDVAIYLEKGIILQSNELALRHLPEGNLLVVCDPDTLAACGWQENDLPFDSATHQLLPSSPKAGLVSAKQLGHKAVGYAGMIAIGSGTINDLCKYAAHQVNIPYLVIATAPSMNGYLSPNASLIEHGHKQSFSCHAPVAVIADIDILAAAPERMIASGIGDTLCRSTIIADSLLSHHICGTLHDTAMSRNMAAYESHLIERMEQDADKTTWVEPLMECLLYAGEAMALAGNSSPASQGEHMLAHLLEMMMPELSSHYLHGEMIAVTTLMMAELQENILTRFAASSASGKAAYTLSPYSPAPFPLSAFHWLKDEEILADWQRAYSQKLKSIRHMSQLAEAFSNIRHSERLSSKRLKELLHTAGCIVDYKVLGFNQPTYERALLLAAYTRNRFTFLDIATSSASLAIPA